MLEKGGMRLHSLFLLRRENLRIERLFARSP